MKLFFTFICLLFVTSICYNGFSQTVTIFPATLDTVICSTPHTDNITFSYSGFAINNEIIVQISNNTGTFANPSSPGSSFIGSSGLLSATSDTISIDLNYLGTLTAGSGYKLRFINKQGSNYTILNTLPYTLDIKIVPTITIAPSTATICAGGNVTLTASGGVSYIWTPTSGLNTTIGNQVNANPTATTTYTVTGTHANGCTASATKVVNVNPIPSVTVTPTSATICTGGNVTLTASGASTYTWSPATGLNKTTGASVTASPINTITYTISGTANNCTGSTTIIVTVNQPPTITITPASVTICSGASATLTASGANTYTWSPSAGLNTTTGSSTTASPTVTTTYTVTGIAANSCSATATRIVNINSHPTLTITGANSICMGASTTLGVSGASTYTWTPATGLNTTTGASVIASPTLNTTYTITGSSAQGCTATGTKSITINPLPSIIITPASITICNGSSSNLSASGANTYTWSPSAGLSSTTGASTTASPTVTTTYTVTGTSLAGCTSTANRIVTVNPSPANPTVSQSPNGTICTNQTKTLTASPTTNVTYTWAVSSGNISPTTGSVTTYTPTAQATVTCTITGTNSYGCTVQQTNSFQSVLFPTYTSAGTANPPTSTAMTMCSGETFSLKSLVSNVNFNINSPAPDDQFRYKWNSTNNSAITANPSLAANTFSTYQNIPTGNIDLNLTNTSNNTIVVTYTIQLKRGGCEGGEITAYILLLPEINATITPSNNARFCNQEPINLTVNSNLNAFLNPSTTYNLSITLPSGLTIQGGGVNSNNNSIGSTTTRSYSNSTTDVKIVSYVIDVSLKINNKTCTSNIAADYKINPSLNSIVPTFPDTICSALNSSISLSALGSTTYTYDWYFSPSQSSGVSCNAICSGNEVTSGIGFTLNLINNGTAALNGVIHYDPVLPNSALGSQGCHKVNGDTTFNIVVLPVPQFTFSPTNLVVCDGDIAQIQFTPTTTGTPNYFYDWVWNNASNNSSNPTTSPNPSIAKIVATVQNLDDTQHVPVSYNVTPRFQVASPAATCAGTTQEISIQVLPTLKGNDTSYIRCEKAQTGWIDINTNEAPSAAAYTTYKWHRTSETNVNTSTLWAQDTITQTYSLPSAYVTLTSNSTTGTVDYDITPIYTLDGTSCNGEIIHLVFTINPAPDDPVFVIESSCLGQKNVYVYNNPAPNITYNWNNQAGLYNNDSTKVFIADPDLLGNSISLTAFNHFSGGVKCSTTKSLPIPNSNSSLPYANTFQLTVNPASMAVLYDLSSVEYSWYKVPKNIFNDNSSFELNTIALPLYPTQNQAVFVFNVGTLNTDEFYYYVDYKSSSNSCIQRSFLNNVSNVLSTPYDYLKTFFKVYPNPASDQIVAEVPYFNGKAVLTLNAPDGRIIKSLQVTSPIQTIDIRDIASGIYILQYHDNNASLLTQKVMILR